MPRYQVIRHRILRVVEEGWIELDAPDQATAEQLADDTGDCEFNFKVEDRETSDQSDRVILIEGAPTDEEADRG